MNIRATGDNIYRLMRSRNRTETWLARQLNVEPETVMNWLNGKRQPTVYAVYRISKLFNVSMETIVEGIDE